MSALAALDYVLIAIVLLSALIGFFRGLFREAMSLVVWIAALWAASRYAWWLSPYLARFVPNAHLRLWAARVVLFLIAVLIAGRHRDLAARMRLCTAPGSAARIGSPAWCSGWRAACCWPALTIVLLRAGGRHR